MSALRRGRAAALPIDNVDTDQLIPARFMSAPRAQGYGRFLLHDLRHGEDGAARPGPWDHHPDILVAGRNFGCGSSREAAVYALVDAGIRVVIAPSFGDIFQGNAVNNGLVPARVSEDVGAALLAQLAEGPAELTLDLEALALTRGDDVAPIALDPVHRLKLINGWDDLDLTAQHAAAIDDFADARRTAAPWVWPRIAAPEAATEPGPSKGR
ncbi:MAG: 3-isopropylmalate dehydratase small subunit [Pseudomonadota bacterium]